MARTMKSRRAKHSTAEGAPDRAKSIKFVSTRKELTDILVKYSNEGFRCYRVQEGCNCRPAVTPERNLTANQRNGVLALDGDKVAYHFVRCRKCKIESEGEERLKMQGYKVQS